MTLDNILLLCSIPCFRHPLSVQRPSFRYILLSLLDTPNRVFFIPQQALRTHKLARVLGAPLEVGENMYNDLRDRYLVDDLYQNVN